MVATAQPAKGYLACSGVSEQTAVVTVPDKKLESMS